MPNRLAKARSPYLLQHKDNPVDWHPWGDEAFQRAKQEDKPVFLSIGYAACHWCHVMEHESFENKDIAALLNKHFICIKVDREERPDIDQIYMTAVQMMTGHGGWPMSVFLTPDRRPFHAGTYWPAKPREGMPSFPQVVIAMAEIWEKRRTDVTKFSKEITKSIQSISSGPGSNAEQPPKPNTVVAASHRLNGLHDKTWGGFGTAPKFPHTTDLELLLRTWHISKDETLLKIVTRTLEKMADGGIYDHLAGGFARYSVDNKWLVPHFEKMLYDNGSLARLYLQTYQITNNPRFAKVASETLHYLIRDMTDDAGGFHSSEDADSEGVEGKFYVWSLEEIKQVLGEKRGERFSQFYDVTTKGNFEGHNILNLPQPITQAIQNAAKNPDDLKTLTHELAQDREKLRLHRNKRIHPGRDDKVLCSWNGLAIDALAIGARVLKEPDFAAAAVKAGEFIWNTMRGPDGRLRHAYHSGTAHLIAYLDDYAYLIEAFVSLYNATHETHWIDRAIQLADQMLEHYADSKSGGFFYTADDSETLITRLKNWHDNSIPSANGAAAEGLLRLGRLTGNESYLASAKQTLVAGSRVLTEQAGAAAKLLLALDNWHHGDQQMVIAAAQPLDAEPLLDAYYERYRPYTTLALVIGESQPKGPLAKLVANKHPLNGQPTLYVCQNYTCDAPMTGDQALTALNH